MLLPHASRQADNHRNCLWKHYKSESEARRRRFSLVRFSLVRFHMHDADKQSERGAMAAVSVTKKNESNRGCPT
jgi:hypothetical protein